MIKRPDILGNSSRKEQLRKCNSLKNLKSNQTSDFSKGKSNTLKRQASSPYLRSSSSTKNLKNSYKKSYNSPSEEKILKNIIKTNLDKDQNKRSLSKKKLKDVSSYMNLLGNEKSLLNRSDSSLNFKKMNYKRSGHIRNSKENNMSKKSLMKSSKGQNNVSNPFLKKKTLIYSYL